MGNTDQFDKNGIPGELPEEDSEKVLSTGETVLMEESLEEDSSKKLSSGETSEDAAKPEVPVSEEETSAASEESDPAEEPSEEPEDEEAESPEEPSEEPEGRESEEKPEDSEDKEEAGKEDSEAEESHEESQEAEPHEESPEEELLRLEAEEEAAEAAAAAKARKKKRLGTIGLISTFVLILLAVGGALFGVYYHYVDYYRTHFYEGTSINGKDVSFKTVDEVKQMIIDGIAEYELRIDEKDGKDEKLTAEDLGWHYVDDHKVDTLMEDQDTWHWFSHRIDPLEYNFAAGTDYDREKAKEAIAKLKCFTSKDSKAPQDAYLGEQKDGFYAVVPEKEGNELDPEKAEETILKALDEASESVSLEEPDCYLHPKIFSDNENLCTRRDEWNRLLNIYLAYDFGENGELINGEFLKPYITDDGEHVTLSMDWVEDEVRSWAGKYDTFGLETSFTTHDGSVVTVPEGGDYGWCLDKEETAKELKEHLKNADRGDIIPVWLYKGMGWSNNGLTGTYVEVSISEQHLWCYKDGELVQDTDVVTGAPTPDRETIRGIFAVDAKKSPAVLGTREVQGYSSPVSYWCPFNGGQGLHDAPWRGAFGGSIYRSNGSHGCVNIPPDRMKVIYDSVEIGTAVVVY